MSPLMHVLDNLTRRRSSRFLWAPLTVVFIGLLYGSHLEQQKAVTDAKADAAVRAESITSGIGTGLSSTDMGGPLTSAARRRVTQAVGEDPTAARVLIYRPDGSAVYSSTEPVLDRSPDGGRFASALAGNTRSVRTTDQLAGDVDKRFDLLETFVPLRVAGETPVVGVVEVDHRFSTLTRSAQSPWRGLQILFFVLAADALVLFVLSLRRPLPPLPRAARAARTGRTGRRRSQPMVGKQSPVDEEMNRLRSALMEEREQRRQAEETYGFLEKRLREGEGPPVQGPSGGGPNDPNEALRLSEARAARAEARAAEAEDRAAEAESRAAEADLRATIAEARSLDQRSIVVESEARAARAETKAVEEEAEVARLRAAEVMGQAELDALRRQLEEARERTRKGVETYAFLESKLREAEDRLQAVSNLGAGADARLAGLQEHLSAAERRAAQAEQELGRLREAEAEVEKLRRQVLREREEVETPDLEALAALAARVEAAEGRAMNADRRLGELAAAASRPEPARPEPAPVATPPAATPPATPPAARPEPTPVSPPATPPAARPEPTPVSPPATPPAARPQPAPVSLPQTRPGLVPAAEDEDADLDEPEPDLPKQATTLRDKLARTAMLKKLGHKDDESA